MATRAGALGCQASNNHRRFSVKDEATVVHRSGLELDIPRCRQRALDADLARPESSKPRCLIGLEIVVVP